MNQIILNLINTYLKKFKTKNIILKYFKGNILNEFNEIKKK